LDNRIENLELWDTSQPKGQRVEDKINFYFSLVEEYKNHPKYKYLIPQTYYNIPQKLFYDIPVR
jgi:hypothetical protein